jgi:hypothetical protein
MIHPDTELCWINAEIGHGVRATRRIPRGTLTWVRCALDRIVTREQADALGPNYRPILDRFSYIDHLGRQTLCWDAGRNINHHCDANSRALGLDVQIAIRDIEPGDELTCDYGECNLDEPLTCQCGAASCRGIVRAADLGEFAEVWDAEIRAAAAVAVASNLAQPILPFAPDPELTGKILRGLIPAPSIAVVATK